MKILIFLSLVFLIWWGSAQASGEEPSGVAFHHEALLLIFLNPLFSAQILIYNDLVPKTIQEKEASSQDRDFVTASNLIAFYSALTGILQLGADVSRSNDKGSTQDNSGVAKRKGAGMKEESSESDMLVAAGGEDHKEDNSDERRSGSGDKKISYLCWCCQKKVIRWKYSCCGKGLCEGCHRFYGTSPAKCPCCGKNRRPWVHCNLCPREHGPMALDQEGVRAHLFSQHLQQRSRGRVHEVCRHCSESLELNLPRQQLINALIQHCFTACIFPRCETVLTAETDNTAHFESSHQGAAECPVSGCTLNRFGHIHQPSAFHMNSHLQYSCCFCVVTINNQLALQAHLPRHIESYRCGSCQGDEGAESLLRVLLMGGHLQQFDNADYTVDLPLMSEMAVINHWAFFHCQISCPICSHALQGSDSAIIQEHIDIVCSRVERLSRSEQERGAFNTDYEFEDGGDPE
ncbi:hypothetical protein [Endozoicomonas sp. 8E]|uniref:hypothetical protein n=1 Tax=Endozoicomonas sp. 8E TaxID=3035692 RepID=UPI0029394265|nr:hypothetical protein [Endozoicomonas sp. 8E]WOG29641.1 hypothetical protein P6910_08300 [Endozoicomonas sp. 8E]